MGTKKTRKTSKSAWEGSLASYTVVIDRLKANPSPLFAYLGIVIASTLASMYFQDKSFTDPDYIPYETIVDLLLIVPVITYALSLADNRKLSVQEFLRFSPRTFLMALSATALFLVTLAGSFLLLIFPLVWTLAWFFFSVFVATEKEVGPITAMKASKQLAQAHKAKVWSFVGITIVMGLGIGGLALLPHIGVYLNALLSGVLSVAASGASALLYRWLQANQQ